MTLLQFEPRKNNKIDAKGHKREALIITSYDALEAKKRLCGVWGGD